jgi:Leucine-rich repeat (LRR) protein
MLLLCVCGVVWDLFLPFSRRTLADAGLSTASQLTTLDCSNLGLCHLSPGILGTLSSLQSINLSHNLLDDASVVDVGLEALASTLTSLDVSDNQVRECDPSIDRRATLMASPTNTSRFHTAPNY